MSLNDVRRHHQSKVRSNDDADSSDVDTTSPGQDTVGPSTADATLTRSGPSSRKRFDAVSSDGTAEPDAATFPSSSRANSSRLKAESRLENEPAHHTTAWCFARVSATYA